MCVMKRAVQEDDFHAPVDTGEHARKPFRGGYESRSGFRNFGSKFIASKALVPPVMICFGQPCQGPIDVVIPWNDPSVPGGDLEPVSQCGKEGSGTTELRGMA